MLAMCKPQTEISVYAEVRSLLIKSGKSENYTNCVIDFLSAEEQAKESRTIIDDSDPDKTKLDLANFHCQNEVQQQIPIAEFNKKISDTDTLGVIICIVISILFTMMVVIMCICSSKSDDGYKWVECCCTLLLVLLQFGNN